jgi:hypothetical protein
MPVLAAARNLLDTFSDLQRSARTAVRIHAGNEVLLERERSHVSRFLSVLNQVRYSKPLLSQSHARFRPVH